MDDRFHTFIQGERFAAMDEFINEMIRYITRRGDQDYFISENALKQYINRVKSDLEKECGCASFKREEKCEYSPPKSFQTSLMADVVRTCIQRERILAIDVFINNFLKIMTGRVQGVSRFISENQLAFHITRVRKRINFERMIGADKKEPIVDDCHCAHIQNNKTCPSKALRDGLCKKHYTV